MAPVFNIAVLIYPGADILDFSGPVEIYSAASLPEEPKNFNITSFSHRNPVTAAGDVLTYVPMASISEIDANLESYDILVIPGAWPEVIQKLIATEEGKGIIELVKKFSNLSPRPETGKRVVQSVCTGTMILAASGILANRTVTTHHIAFDIVKQLADQVSGGESNTKVVPKRWVDAGTTDAGVRIVNAGGVSSGLDASLWIIEELVGKKYADFAAEIVEFSRRKQDDAWGV